VEYEDLEEKRKVKQASLKRLNEDYKRVLEEKNAALRINNKYRQQMEEYRVPQVGHPMHYQNSFPGVGLCQTKRGTT
jgi:hypothetical protein